jgi:hypothetical protein
MNGWFVAGVISLLVVAVIGAGMIMANQNSTKEISEATTKSCGGCNGSCISESNCGLFTCKAVSGGTCDCGRTSSEKSCTSTDGCSSKNCGLEGCSASVGKTCNCGK